MVISQKNLVTYICDIKGKLCNVHANKMKRDKPLSKQGLVYTPMDVAELDEIYLSEDA